MEAVSFLVARAGPVGSLVVENAAIPRCTQDSKGGAETVHSLGHSRNPLPNGTAWTDFCSEKLKHISFAAIAADYGLFHSTMSLHRGHGRRKW